MKVLLLKHLIALFHLYLFYVKNATGVQHILIRLGYLWIINVLNATLLINYLV